MAYSSSSCSLAHGRTSIYGINGRGLIYRLVKDRKGVQVVSSSGEKISLFNDATGDEAKHYDVRNYDGLVRAGPFLVAYNKTMASFIAHDICQDLTACSFRYNGPVWRKGKKSKEKKMKKKKRKDKDLVERGIMGPICSSLDHDQLSLVFFAEENSSYLNAFLINPRAGYETEDSGILEQGSDGTPGEYVAISDPINVHSGFRYQERLGSFPTPHGGDTIVSLQCHPSLPLLAISWSRGSVQLWNYQLLRAQLAKECGATKEIEASVIALFDGDVEGNDDEGLADVREDEKEKEAVEEREKWIERGLLPIALLCPSASTTLSLVGGRVDEASEAPYHRYAMDVSLANISYNIGGPMAAVAWGIASKSGTRALPHNSSRAPDTGSIAPHDVDDRLCVGVSVYDLRQVESACSDFFSGTGDREGLIVKKAAWPLVVTPTVTNPAPRHGVLGLAIHTRDPLLMLVSIPSTCTDSSTSSTVRYLSDDDIDTEALPSLVGASHDIPRQAFKVTYLSLRSSRLCATSTVTLDAGSLPLKEDTQVDQTEVTYHYQSDTIFMCMRQHNTSSSSHRNAECTAIYRMPLGISSQQGALFSSVSAGPGFNFTPRLPLWRYLGEEDPLWASITKAVRPPGDDGILKSKAKASRSRQRQVTSPDGDHDGGDGDGDGDIGGTRTVRSGIGPSTPPPSLTSCNLPLLMTMLPTVSRRAEATASSQSPTPAIGGIEDRVEHERMGLVNVDVSLLSIAYDRVSAPTLAQQQQQQQQTARKARVLLTLPCDFDGKAWRKVEKERDILELSRVKAGVPYFTRPQAPTAVNITGAGAGGMGEGSTGGDFTPEKAGAGLLSIGAPSPFSSLLTSERENEAPTTSSSGVVLAETAYSSSSSSVQSYERHIVRQQMMASGHWYVGFSSNNIGNSAQESGNGQEESSTSSDIRRRARSIRASKPASSASDSKARLGGDEILQNPRILHFSFTPQEVVMDDVTIFGTSSGDARVMEPGAISKRPFDSTYVPSEGGTTNGNDYGTSVNEVSFAIIKGSTHYLQEKNDTMYRGESTVARVSNTSRLSVAQSTASSTEGAVSYDGENVIQVSKGILTGNESFESDKMGRSDDSSVKGTPVTVLDPSGVAPSMASSDGRAAAANSADLKCTPCVAFTRFRNATENVGESEIDEKSSSIDQSLPYQQWQLTSRFRDAAFWAGRDGVEGVRHGVLGIINRGNLLAWINLGTGLILKTFQAPDHAPSLVLTRLWTAPIGCRGCVAFGAEPTFRPAPTSSRIAGSGVEAPSFADLLDSEKDAREYLLLTDATVRFGADSTMPLLSGEHILSITWQPRTQETNSTTTTTSDEKATVDATETVTCPSSHLLLAVLTNRRVLVVAWKQDDNRSRNAHSSTSSTSSSSYSSSSVYGDSHASRRGLHARKGSALTVMFSLYHGGSAVIDTEKNKGRAATAASSQPRHVTRNENEVPSGRIDAVSWLGASIALHYSSGEVKFIPVPLGNLAASARLAATATGADRDSESNSGRIKSVSRDDIAKMHRSLINKRRAGLRPGKPQDTSAEGGAEARGEEDWNILPSSSLVSLMHLPSSHARATSCPSAPFVLFLPDRALVLERRVHSDFTANGEGKKSTSVLSDKMALSVRPVSLLEPLIASTSALWHYARKGASLCIQNGDARGQEINVKRMEVLCATFFQLIKTHIVPPSQQHAQDVALAGGSVLPSLRNTACTRSLASSLSDELANLKQVSKERSHEKTQTLGDNNTDGMEDQIRSFTTVVALGLSAVVGVVPAAPATTSVSDPVRSSGAEKSRAYNKNTAAVSEEEEEVDAAITVDYFDNTDLFRPWSSTGMVIDAHDVASSPALTASRRGAGAAVEKVSLRYDHPLELLRGTGSSTCREQEHYTSILLSRRACHAYATRVASLNAEIRAGGVAIDADARRSGRPSSTQTGMVSTRDKSGMNEALTVTIAGDKPHPHGALASLLSAWEALHIGSSSSSTNLGGSVSDRILLNYLLSRDETTVRAWGLWRAHYQATRGGHYGCDRGQYVLTLARSGPPSSPENTNAAFSGANSVDQTIFDQARRLGALRKARKEGNAKAEGGAGGSVELPLAFLNGHQTPASATFHLSTMLNNNGTSFVSVESFHDVPSTSEGGMSGSDVANLTKDTTKLAQLITVSLPLPTVAQVASQEEEEEEEEEEEDEREQGSEEGVDEDDRGELRRGATKTRAYHRYRPHHLQHLHAQQQRHIRSHALGTSSGSADADRGRSTGIRGQEAVEAPSSSSFAPSFRRSKAKSKSAWKEQTVLMGDVLEEWCNRVSQVEMEEKMGLPGNLVNVLTGGSAHGNGNISGIVGLEPTSHIQRRGSEASSGSTDSAAFFTTPKKSRMPMSTNSASTTAAPADVGPPSLGSARGLTPPRLPSSSLERGLPPPRANANTKKPSSTTHTAPLLGPPKRAPTSSPRTNQATKREDEVSHSAVSASVLETGDVTTASSPAPVPNTIRNETAAEPASPTSPGENVRVRPSNAHRQAPSGGTRLSSGVGLLSAPKRNKFIAKGSTKSE